MGVFKKFIGALACESALIQPGTSDNYIGYQISQYGYSQSYNTFPYKSLDGTSRNSMTWNYGKYGKHHSGFSASNFILYGFMTAIPTADLLTNYDFNDYEIVSVCEATNTSTKYIRNNSAGIIYTINMFNSSETDITVNAIKFKKKIGCSGDTDIVTCELLVYAYYLDSPLTIPAGDSRTITIEMKVGTDVSVNET